MAQWTLRSATADGWEKLSEEFGLHPLAARMLARRGYSDPERADSFLHPKLRDMHDPGRMAGMEEAVRCTLEAIEAEERIAVHGDYDVDGLTSTAILLEFFRAVGVEADYTIPRRLEDGYGLDREVVAEHADRGTDLLITADCGITAHESIAAARETGMTVIVVDHHAVPSTMPPADAILNPRRSTCSFPFEDLAAAGVTFNFAVALRRAMRDRGAFSEGEEPELMGLLDLVALGTVADVVPLVDENRAFVRRGLELLTERPRPGLGELIRRTGANDGPVTTQTIGYKLAPRLNAAGRLADASICVELMTTHDRRRARAIADRLEKLNAERKGIQSDILQRARAVVQEYREDSVIVVDGEDWHRGILGIVAGRLSEQFHRPVVALDSTETIAEGSARSIDGVDIVDVLSEADDVLESYGGHAAAAGLSVRTDRIDPLRERLRTTVDERWEGSELPEPSVDVEERVHLGTLDHRFVEDLHRLRPFGAGNPEPVLACDEIEAKRARIVGEDHLKAEFTDGTAELSGIGFSMGERMDMLEDPVAAAFVPRWSVFRGRGQLEMHLRDLRPVTHDLFGTEADS